MDFGIALEVAEKLEAIREAKKCGQNVEYAVKVLADYIFNTGDTGEYLNAIAKSVLANPPDIKEGQLVPFRLTPDMLLTSDFLVDKINHWVELVRTEIFGSSQAPFSSIAEAAKWIQQQENEEPSPKQAWDESFILEGYHHIYLRRMPCLGYDGNEDYATLTSSNPPEWSMPELRGRARHYTPLSWLESETRIMAQFTGFTQLSLIQYTLTGIKPILQRFTTRGTKTLFNMPNKEKLQPIQVEINIIASDLSFQELQEIYTEYRTYLQLQRGRALNEKHLTLYRLVNSKGGPPKGKGTVAFWNSVRDEWKGLYHNDAHRNPHWKGVKQNYERVIQKLKDRFESTKLGAIPQKEAQNERTHNQKG